MKRACTAIMVLFIIITFLSNDGKANNGVIKPDELNEEELDIVRQESLALEEELW